MTCRGSIHRLLTIAAVLVAATATMAGPPGADSAGADDPPTVHEDTFSVGPHELAPVGEEGDQVNELFVDVPRPSGDIAVKGITWRLVDGDGEAVPAHMAHLHHLVLLDTARPDQLCSFPPASRFAATGMELSRFQLPEPYAYHSPADAAWQGVYHVMNQSSEPMEVAIEYTVEWVEPGEHLDVEPYFLDVDGCWGDSEYEVPGDGGPGSVHEVDRTYTMTREGIFVRGGGHLHDGGIDITLDGPDGEVCRSEAVYGDGDGHHGDLVGVTGCGSMDEEFVVGDEYTLTSRYRNDHHIPGAMGIMLTYIHHTDPPPPEPSIEILETELTGDGFEMTVMCDEGSMVYANVQLSQVKGQAPVTGWGYDEFDCAGAPMSVVLPVSGDGVVTGGPVEFAAYAEATDGRRYVYDDMTGTVHHRGRLDLTSGPPPDGGNLPITVDRAATRGESGPVITGTVHCDEPQDLFINASGAQRVGRHYVNFSGGTGIACDGDTAFAVNVSSYDGRLAGGPAQVTVYGWSSSGEVAGVTSRRVRLPGGPPSDGAEPDPDSPLTIDAVHRTGDGVVMTATWAGCQDGAELWVQAAMRRAAGRVNGSEEWTSGFVMCDGGDATVTLSPVTGINGNKVMVEAYAYVEHDSGYDEASTWGEFRVR